MDASVILDRQLIIDVASRYASGLDTRDIAKFGSCFTENARWAGPGQDTQGREAIVALAKKITSSLVFSHHLTSNFEIEIAGDSATMRSLFQATTARAPDRAVVLLGHYSDSLTRTPDGWKFSERTIHVSARSQVEIKVITPPTPRQAAD